MWLIAIWHAIRAASIALLPTPLWTSATDLAEVPTHEAEGMNEIRLGTAELQALYGPRHAF